MKKTIFATLALGTAITFGGFSQASADEIDHTELAEKAKANSEELNNNPIKEGNYDITFSDNTYTYHFYNNNGIFGWEYHYGVTEETPVQKLDQQQSQFDVQNEQDTKDIVQPKQEAVQPTSVSAPVKKETKQPTASTSKSGGSVAEQIRQAGGDEAMVEIAMRESTMNPNAVNASSGAQGLFQGLGKSWSGGSIAEQTKGAKQYMIDRYGSTSGALSYHDSKGWY